MGMIGLIKGGGSPHVVTRSGDNFPKQVQPAANGWGAATIEDPRDAGHIRKTAHESAPDHFQA
jgi:hypothetical protein